MVKSIKVLAEEGDNLDSSTSISVTREIIKTASENTPIIVDFDETLLLRNSTAEYLNSLQPRLIGALLLKILNYLQPWNWLPPKIRGKTSRDWLLVVVSTLLLPWTLLLWQDKAKKLAKNHSNAELIAALNQNPHTSVVVGTLGFKFIVSPIIKHLPINYSQLIACRFWRGAVDRNQGKLQMVTEVLGVEAVERSIVITDSLDDAPLLAKAAKPCYVVWSQAVYTIPMNDIYLPFFYLEKIKRPGQKYLLRVILGEDLLIMLFSLSWLSPHPIIHALSILFLLVSFWCIYEIGYWENDLVAEKYEEKPVLSEAYQSYKQIINFWQPYFWSLSFAVIGIILLVTSQNNIISNNQFFFFSSITVNKQLLVKIFLTLIKWLGFLLAMRFCFWIYNYVNKRTRIWLYLPLQMCRYFGYVLITPINIVSAILLGSHVLKRYLPYAFYRYAGGNSSNWPKLPSRLLSLLIFVLILFTLTLGSKDISLLLNGQTLTILLWFFVQASHRIWQEICQVRPIWRDGSNEVSEIINPSVVSKDKYNSK
jgi:phosphoserine phosphatase